MPTTPGGLPYPLGSDPVANGAQDIQDLAEAVDPGLGLYLVTTCTATFAGGTAGSVSNGVVTIGTSNTSVTVANAFSANFDNYLIIITGGSGTQAGLQLQLGSTVTGYYSQTVYGVYTNNTVLGFGPGNASSFANAGYSSANGLDARIELRRPFLAERTVIESSNAGALTGEAFYRLGGFLNDATSYTSFKITPASGSISGAKVRVYGYRN